MKDPSLWETVEHKAQELGWGAGKNAEQNATDGQCRVQCTRGAHKCSATRGRAERSAQSCPGQLVVVQKDTEYNSPFSHGAEIVYGCMTTPIVTK